MGYNLSIGNFKASIYPEERYACGDAECPDEVDGAPLNSSDHHGACIHPSYTAWANFSKAVGLYSLFFAPRSECGSVEKWWVDDKGEEHDGLIRQHPGAAKLTPAHLRAFKAAKDKYLALPEPRPGVCQEDSNIWRSEKGVDYNLRRLDWLIFWTDWALKNCEYPTFANS